LSRERLLAAAISLADRDGIETLSMRKLAQQLGYDPMSLYNHVRNKEDLLDGIADAVVGEIQPSVGDTDWKAAMRRTVLAARRTLLRHPWAANVIESRRDPGPATLRYLDTVLGILRRGGFSMALAHHTLHVMGSRVLGFSQDLFDDANDRPDPDAAANIARSLAPAYPNLAELARTASHEGGLGGCDDDREFEFALDLILDGLDRLRDG
jgi:AcrR family transcriptional regulator